METRSAPSVLDLFAAPGGLSQGFKDAGYRILAVIDNDRWGCETLKYNHCKNETLLIKSEIEEVPSKIRGHVDIVVGGPPCQSFSHIGRPKINHLTLMDKRKRFIDDRRNRLYKHFVSIVNEFRPQFFVMENVPGIVSFREGRVRDQILEDFEKIGYETDVEILNAASFGVPQIRNRAIFVGNRNGMKNLFPKRTHYDPLKRLQNTLEESTGKWKPCLTIFDAISDLPPLQAGKGEDETEYPPVSILTSYQRWAREGSRKLYNHVARGHSERDRELKRGFRTR